MQAIDGSPPTTAPAGREMTRIERIVSRTRGALVRFRRRLPYIVWWGDELDVVVTLSQDKLDPERGIEQLWSGAFADVERGLREMGIGFDTGMGPAGRDWEWDWSLKGPISVRFRGRASKPWLRMERPRPRLVRPLPPAA